MATDWKSVLAAVTSVWDRQIRYAAAVKEKQFGDTARFLWGFLGKSFQELYKDNKRFRQEEWAFLFPGADDPSYQPRINLSAQFVQVMTPYILSKVPTRVVEPSRPPLPSELLAMSQQVAMAQQAGAQVSEQLRIATGLIAQAAPRLEETRIIDQIRAYLMQWFLRWTPNEYGLVQEQRQAIPEALVKGRGVVWIEMHRSPTGGPTSQGIPASFQETVDFQFVDGNCRQFRDAGFIARYREAPIWQLVEEWGANPEELRSHVANHEGRLISKDLPVKLAADSAADERCPYLEVYSRIGLGQRFNDPGEEIKQFNAKMEAVGRYVRLIFVPGMKHPLNLPPDIAEVATEDQLRVMLSWPIPFYDELSNPFPCSNLDFLPSSESCWPRSPLEAAAPLQVFIDHLWAYLMVRVRRECRALVLLSKDVDEALEEATERGLDLEIIRCSGPIGQEFVRVLELPPLNRDVWQILPMARATFEEMTGMQPLLQGGVGETQPRTAAEMTIRDQRVASRPDDYADSHEAWNAVIAAKEGQAARMLVDPTVVAPLFGEDVQEGFDPENPDEPVQFDPENPDLTLLGPLSQLWALIVNTPDPADAVADLAYTIEASSGRRKNKQKQLSDLQSINQALAPILTQAYQMTGNPRQLNAYIDIMDEALDAGGKFRGMYFEQLAPQIPGLQQAQPENPQ